MFCVCFACFRAAFRGAILGCFRGSSSACRSARCIRHRLFRLSSDRRMRDRIGLRAIKRNSPTGHRDDIHRRFCRARCQWRVLLSNHSGERCGRPKHSVKSSYRDNSRAACAADGTHSYERELTWACCYSRCWCRTQSDCGGIHAQDRHQLPTTCIGKRDRLCMVGSHFLKR